jgi:glutathione S-transferase
LWFVGDEFTAADVQMSFPIEMAGIDASRPKLTEYLQTIHARPAYQQALARGGKYEIPS